MFLLLDIRFLPLWMIGEFYNDDPVSTNVNFVFDVQITQNLQEKAFFMLEAEALYET